MAFVYSRHLRSPAATTTAHLRIVAINDVYELDNLPRLRTFLGSLQDNRPSAVVLAGDFLSPSTLSSIDLGRGMVDTLRALGMSHVSLGNHEQDFGLAAMRRRFEELKEPVLVPACSPNEPFFTPYFSHVRVLNSNIRSELATMDAEWMETLTHPFDIVTTPCSKVRVAFLGLLSDEPQVFRDGTFRGIPIDDMIETYQTYYQQLLQPTPSGGTESTTSSTNMNAGESDGPLADICIPLTHAGISRDRELAQAMLEMDHIGHDHGLIIGGHDHEPYDESVYSEEGDRSVRILKSGMEANAASLIDLTFQLDPEEQKPPKLTNIDYSLVELKDYAPCVTVQKIVDKHQAILKAFELESIVDINKSSLIPAGTLLSSRGTRFEQTTLGSVFCSMIKEELEADAAILNGAVIKGNTVYPDNQLTYAQLKKELPFPTKMVVVPMERYILDEAITYSRTAIEEKLSPEQLAELQDRPIARRAYLQVDWEYEEQQGSVGSGLPDDILRVAVPRNLLNGFCKIKPLMEVGASLKEQGLFPGPNDFIPAIDVIIRSASKNRWMKIVHRTKVFEKFDRNGDGVLDRDELRILLEHYLGREPSDFVIDDMMAAIDGDGNGVIDQGEFSWLRAEIERDRGRFG
eukprot:Nitzschia sp. Nitz4//scaffold14_size191712//159090//160985//NITZ4_001751-RA/size191712-processed-gene-0.289-mRNA-1//1//CDS//3329537011//9318//frame0